MLELIKPMLGNAWRLALIVVPLGVAGYVGYNIGKTQATRHYQVAMAEQQVSHEQQMLDLVNDKNAELQSALTDLQRMTQHANQIGLALLETRSKLASTLTELKQRIDHATSADGERFTGLGPDSLRVYRAALGYPESDPDLSTADGGNAGQAGQAASPAPGLPPADLLEHAADYGQWCQQVDAQLNAYLQLHTEGAQP